MLHKFNIPTTGIPLPKRFTYPFCYTPHPLCVMAAEELQHYLNQQDDWQEELKKGKMFGVLVVQTQDGEIGYLTAFSGILAGENKHPHFVPPVYDLLQPQGFFKLEEQKISDINLRIKQLEDVEDYTYMRHKLALTKKQAEDALNIAKQQLRAAKDIRDQRRKELLQVPTGLLQTVDEPLKPDGEQPQASQASAALIRESQHQKAEYKRLEASWKNKIAALQLQINHHEQQIQTLKTERKTRSAALQQRLFDCFKILNQHKDVKSLSEIFAQTPHKTPPAGAGECAAPKLLQQAYLHNWKPIAMAEFWWGNSPKTEIRHHGHYYPACKGKCEPILQHALQGLDVEENPLLQAEQNHGELRIVYEDQWLMVVNKPHGMLSVPGKSDTESVYSIVKRLCPEADGPMIVHRLDMATSGLLIIAKKKDIHQHLQEQFRNHTIRKVYVALLDGIITQNEGVIELPIRPNPLDRPRQMVDPEHGKPAITHYKVIERTDRHTRIALYPHTGRTHQLRMHAAHTDGLHNPIIGDELYGRKNKRLYLHAEVIEFIHPHSRQTIRIEQKADF